MKIAIGDDASLTLPSGTSLKADSYGYTNNLRLINTTGFEDGEWDTFETGGRTAALVFTGHPKYDAAGTTPDLQLASVAAGAYTLTVAPGCTIAANFKKYQAGIAADKKTGGSRITILAQQTGDATVTWDQTA